MKYIQLGALLVTIGSLNAQQIPNLDDRAIVSLRPNGTQVPTNDTDGPYLHQGCDSHKVVTNPTARFIAYESTGALVSSDTNNRTDIYVRDRQTNTTSLASRGHGNALGATHAKCPRISNDGRFVAFVSDSSNMWPGLSNDGTNRIYLRDLDSNQTSLVSVKPNGQPAAAASNSPALSGSGQFIAFTSESTDLVSSTLHYFQMPLTQGHSLPSTNVFVRNLSTGQNEIITRNAWNPAYASDGTEVSHLSISNDGRYISFASNASDLVRDYPICSRRGVSAVCMGNNVYIYDRTLQSMRLVRLPFRYINSIEQPAMSPNGQWIVVQSSQSSVWGTTGLYVYRNVEPYALATYVPGTF